MTDRVDRQSFASEATRATFITRQDSGKKLGFGSGGAHGKCIDNAHPVSATIFN